mmetsp:Transcript_862/g.2683  ORF Transcript_862/g.2683 Transcript_862/m.2683 type:complete len:208 (+) Transcript_862:2022-2645(+)
MAHDARVQQRWKVRPQQRRQLVWEPREHLEGGELGGGKRLRLSDPRRAPRQPGASRAVHMGRGWPVGPQGAEQHRQQFGRRRGAEREQQHAHAERLLVHVDRGVGGGGAHVRVEQDGVQGGGDQRRIGGGGQGGPARLEQETDLRRFADELVSGRGRAQAREGEQRREGCVQSGRAVLVRRDELGHARAKDLQPRQQQEQRVLPLGK